MSYTECLSVMVMGVRDTETRSCYATCAIRSQLTPQTDTHTHTRQVGIAVHNYLGIYNYYSIYVHFKIVTTL